MCRRFDSVTVHQDPSDVLGSFRGNTSLANIKFHLSGILPMACQAVGFVSDWPGVKKQDRWPEMHQGKGSIHVHAWGVPWLGSLSLDFRLWPV